MTLNPIGIAVPFFFVLIVVELWAGIRKRTPVYRLNDTMTDLGCGMGDQVLGIFVKGVTLALYTAVFSGVGLLQLDVSSPWTWLIGMLGVDLLYYCFHRFAHRVHLGWVTHVVHHQSEEYNLAVALRQPWFTQLYGWIFYLPLAVLGLPPEVWLASYSVNLLYQFWIHTRLIGKLGPVEWVMNTPSHHRVHHGTNPAYIDKNYAGIFIIWDRAFGTFVEEDEEPVYGTLSPLRSWNPLVANIQPFGDLYRLLRERTDLRGRLMALIGPPGWTPEGERHPPFPSPDRGYDRQSIARLWPYIVAHLLPVTVVLSVVLSLEAQLSQGVLILASAYIVWTSLAWAGLVERRNWALPFELGRLVVVTSGALLWGVGQALVPVLIAVSIIAMSLASAAWVWGHRQALVD
jgi:sterol desaturase/sphingolipid hydroxylase (fatty acid hydroxylase superfamily)